MKVAVMKVAVMGAGAVGCYFGGLLARAVVAIDESGKVMYTELVPEIAQEPDYDAVLAAL